MNSFRINIKTVSSLALGFLFQANTLAISFPGGPTITSRVVRIPTQYQIYEHRDGAVPFMPIPIRIGVPERPLLKMIPDGADISDAQEEFLRSIDFYLYPPGTNIVKTVLQTYRDKTVPWSDQEMKFIAQCHVWNGQLDVAAEMFKELFEADSTDYMSAYRLAVIYTVLGVNDEAASELAELAWKHETLPRIRNFVGVRAILDSQWEKLGDVVDEILDSSVGWTCLDVELMYVYCVKTENLERGSIIIKRLASLMDNPRFADFKNDMTLCGFVLENKYQTILKTDEACGKAIQRLKEASSNYTSICSVLESTVDLVQKIHILDDMNSMPQEEEHKCDEPVLSADP